MKNVFPPKKEPEAPKPRPVVPKVTPTPATAAGADSQDDFKNSLASIIGRGRPGGTIKKKAPESEQPNVVKVKRDIFGGEDDDDAEADKMFGLNTGGIGLGGTR